MFLDIEQAFERGSHESLIYKLKKSNSRIATFVWPLDFCWIGEDCVKIEDCVSSERRIDVAVPQVSVLGPILFSIYVNDVPRESGCNSLCSRTIRRFPVPNRTRTTHLLDSNASSIPPVQWSETGRWKSTLPRTSWSFFPSTGSRWSSALESAERTCPGQIKWNISVFTLTYGCKSDRRTHAQMMHRKTTARLGQLCPVLASSSMIRKLSLLTQAYVTTYVMPVITMWFPSGSGWPLCI